MTEFATVPDLLRLVVVPSFGYLAWRDVKTRRVPNRAWYPLAALAVVLLAWETVTVLTGDVRSFERNRFFLQVGISIFFLIPLSYGFWLMGGFGGADTKAFMMLAVLLPTYPTYRLSEFGVDGALALLPVVQADVGVFSLTVLSNTVLFGALYPVALAAKNGVSGYVSPGMFVAKPIRWDETTGEYGTLLEFSDRRLRDDLSLSGLGAYFSWRSLDLDALRMYLRWRGLALDDLRADPDRYRDPASLPDEPNPPGDGSIPDGGYDPTGDEGRPRPDGGASDDAGTDQSPDGADGGAEGDDAAVDEATERGDTGAGDTDGDDAPGYDDPWGAEAFLDDIEGSAYGTTPETLREGLETLASEEVVWFSPGIPFLVPLFAGLVFAFTYGDLLFVSLSVLGFV